MQLCKPICASRTLRCCFKRFELVRTTAKALWHEDVEKNSFFSLKCSDPSPGGLQHKQQIDIQRILLGNWFHISSVLQVTSNTIYHQSHKLQAMFTGKMLTFWVGAEKGNRLKAEMNKLEQNLQRLKMVVWLCHDFWTVPC